ncbi:MAG: TetR/AcrR family transcriptional regulator [Polyangiaceae bacterium]
MSDAALRVPVQSRSHKTRAAVIEAAMQEFSERGYAVTTAKSIAERAQVGTGTFYFYFPDKDAVLREIAAERVRWMLERSAAIGAPPSGEDVASDARQRLRRLTLLYLDYHREDRGLHAVITERRLCDPAVDAIMAGSEREAVRRLSAVLTRWGCEGAAEVPAYMMFSLLEGAVHGHVLSQPLLSDATFVAGLVEGLFRLVAPSLPTPATLATPAKPRARKPRKKK